MITQTYLTPNSKGNALVSGNRKGDRKSAGVPGMNFSIRHFDTLGQNDTIRFSQTKINGIEL
jgi:hypothetical protein